ncbi:MAG TPA: hypothetical protein PKY82_21420 [Pyrinomonadaceae bacterium]|nr:hypothetical protein [Pyrinomonadaceae bacterium]
MKLVTEKDEMMRRYLLDQMSDEELNSIEEKFLADDDFFDEIAAVEDELYYDYKAGNLSANDKIAFEKKFLATSADLQKADFAQALLQATTEVSAQETAPGLWQSVVAFFNFSNASLRLGTAAASILLLFIVGFLIFNNLNKQKIDVAEVPEVPETQTPTPTLIDEKIIEQKQKEKSELERKLAEEKQKSELDANKIKEIEKQKEKIQNEIEKNQNKQITPEQPQKSFIALILSPSLVRGSGAKTAKVKVTPELKTINLTLPIKKDFQNEEFKIVVRNIDSGATVSSSNARTGKKTAVSVGISAKNLQRGAYEVVLITPENEELASYYFNVEK